MKTLAHDAIQAQSHTSYEYGRWSAPEAFTQKILRGQRHGIQRSLEVVATSQVRKSLAKYHHIGERTRHRETAIVDGIVQQYYKRVTTLLGQLHYPAIPVAAHDQVSPPGAGFQRLFKHRHPFGTIAGPRERDSEIIAVGQN
jgi:hypothetical protein